MKRRAQPPVDPAVRELVGVPVGRVDAVTPAGWVKRHVRAVRERASSVPCAVVWQCYVRSCVAAPSMYASACTFGRAMTAAGYKRGHAGASGGPQWRHVELVGVEVPVETMEPAAWLAVDGSVGARALELGRVETAYRVYRQDAAVAGRVAVGVRAFRQAVAAAQDAGLIAVLTSLGR